MVTTARKTARRAKRKILCSLALAIAGVICADYWLYPYGSIGGKSFDKGTNGLWLRYTWALQAHPALDYSSLATLLNRQDIAYAYCHVRSADGRGRLQFHDLTDCRALNRALAKNCPGVKRLAWVFFDSGKTDISNLGVRDSLVNEAKWLTKSAGFQGVQWDVEPAPNASSSYLDLLSETRSALDAGSLLGVATPPIFPFPFGGEGWNASYFAEVASRVDQIAVMEYDTGAYFPRLYAGMVAANCREITRAVKESGGPCQVLFGLPAYVAGGSSHNPRAENLSIALKAVREGLDAADANPNACSGVALFAEYTMTNRDWAIYDRLWRR